MKEHVSTMARAELVIAFVEVKGTLPMATRVPDSVEAEAYRALARMRLLKRKGKLEPEVSTLLDSVCPGWPDGNEFRLERAWRERRDELVQWMTVHQRPPYRLSGQDAERGLAGFIASHRRLQYREEFPERIKELDELSSGWDETPVWAPHGLDQRNYFMPQRQVAAMVAA